jgi:hypothetical protein
MLLLILCVFLCVYDAYIRVISFLYLSWMSLRLSLNAAVTRPISGDQTSLHRVIAVGTSYLLNLPVRKEQRFIQTPQL